MKKNLFFIACLLLANIFSVKAETKETLYIEELCNITIKVDKASNIVVTTQAGHGTILSLTDGTSVLQVDDNNENPLQIEPAEGAKIISVLQNGSEKSPSGDGKYRLGISEGMNLEITTESLSADPKVTFSIDDPSHIIVKANDLPVTDLTIPKNFTKGTTLTIAAAEGYTITHVSTDILPSVPSTNGVYTLILNQDIKIYITTKVIDPIVTFEVDYPQRVSVLNQETNKTIDISSSQVSLPVGTILEIQASDAKYSIKSFKVNGIDKQPSGGSQIYNLGISANTTISIETSSTVPAVKFVVDKPENVKVHLLDSEEILDVAQTYEFEKNTQLVIEPASDEVRIASVMANGMKITPLANGNYMTAIATDMTIEIKTKGILPTLTFNVDTPERIHVWNGEEKLNISELVEVAAGTEITIGPAAENFTIKSVVADGKALTPGTDQKYHVTVSGDMTFDIKTAASLTLHIIQPEGGKVSVFHNDVELQEGDKVITGDELSFKNTADEGYTFLSYLLNGKECIETYTVSGSEDITVSAKFRAIKEGYALVTFDLDELGSTLLNIKERNDSEIKNIDPSQPYEIKKGNQIFVYTFTTSMIILSCTMNDLEVPADTGQEGKSYTMTINENAVVKVRTGKLVNITGEITNDASYNRIGEVKLKYKGEIGHDFTLPVGETVELVPLPAAGYELDFYYTRYDESTKFTENSYTITKEDEEREIVVIKGAFKNANSIKSLNAIQSYYDVNEKQLITIGGNTKIYTVSGEIILESIETNISVASLKEGVYIVKTQDRIFKLIKK